MLDKVMRGEKFYGRNTERGDVLLVAGEGRVGLNKRLAALHGERPYLDGRGIGVSYELPAFANETSIVVEILKLERLILRSQQNGETIRLVVLDNLIAMVGGGDVNTSKDTRPIFKALDDLAHKLKICIAVIHHENRSGSTAGSFAIRASVDVMLHITEDKKTGVRTVSGDKARDDPKSQNMQFRLKSVKVGINKWGNDVSSCVVVPVLSGETMGAVVDEDGDESPLTPTDTPNDKIAGALRALRTCVARTAATLGDDPDETGASAGEVFVQLNTDRRAAGLPDLKDRTIAPKLLAKLVEAGKLVKHGANKGTEYRVAPD
jgi:hypothetical protein